VPGIAENIFYAKITYGQGEKLAVISWQSLVKNKKRIKGRRAVM